MAINEKAWSGGFIRVKGTETAKKTIAIGVENTSQQLHVLDVGLAGTDLGLSADTYPSLYIHGTASVSEYIKIYDDATDGYISVTGGNARIKSDGDVRFDPVVTTGYVQFLGTASWGTQAGGTPQALTLKGPAGTYNVYSWLKIKHLDGTNVFIPTWIAV